MPTVVIVGGGISGLALAYRLQAAAPGVDVVLLERGERVGGTIRTDIFDGFRVEAGPNGFLDSKPSTRALCQDLGIGGRLVRASAVARNRYLFHKNRLQKLPESPWGLLKTGLLSWRGKWGLATERFRTSPPPDKDESIDAFTRRRAGPEVAEVLADAFVTGIHAGDPRLLSVRAAFPRLADLEAKHGSVIKGFVAAARQRRAEARARGETPQRSGTMWSFAEGLQTLIDSLKMALLRPPITGVQVRRLEKNPQGPGWIVHGQGTERWPADAVVLACPAHEQGPILEAVDTELATEIAAIPYNRVAVVALGYRTEDIPFPLDGFGFLVPQRDRRDLLGVQWCSSLFPDRAPAGCALLRAMCGGWNRPDMVDWEERRLLEAIRGELRIAMGIQAEPIFHRIVRWDRAIPQYHLGHLQRVARIETLRQRHAGLFLGGNAYRGVALNDCTEQAGVLATAIAKSLP